MANYYWVGGTGTWNTSNTTPWASTSGGAGGAGVPTLSDNAFLDANSGAVTVTTASPVNCLSLDCTGFTGTLTTGSTTGFNIYGGLKFSGTMTLSGGSGGGNWPNFLANTSNTGGTPWIIDFAGKTLQTGTNMAWNAANGYWQLANNITLGAGDTAQHFGGTLNTANYSISGGAFTSTGTVSRALILANSTISATAYTFSGNNLTIYPNTSTIVTSTSTTSFGGNGLTFYNLTMNATAGSSLTITSNNTFNGNLTITNAQAQVGFDSTQIVSGTLTINGSTSNNRCFVYSTTGTQINLNVNSLSSSYIDFNNIVATGNAAPFTPTTGDFGDCGLNANITFRAAKTYYYNFPAGGQAWNSTVFANTSGGTPSFVNYPLPQDTVIIDDTGLSSGSTLPISNITRLPTIDATSKTVPWILNVTAAPRVFKNILIPTISSGTGSSIWTIGNSGNTVVINTGGNTTSWPISFDPGASLSFAGDLKSSSTLTFTSANTTFNANNYNIAFSTVTATGTSNGRTLTMGSGTWTISGTGAVWAVANTGLTFNANTGTIYLSGTTTTARTFTSPAFSYYSMIIGGVTGISTTTIFGTNTTFISLSSNKTVSHNVRFGGGNTISIGSWGISGSSGNPVGILSSNTTNVFLKFTGSGVVNADWLNISNSVATPANTWYAGPNSTQVANVSGWIFTAAPSGNVTTNGLLFGSNF